MKKQYIEPQAYLNDYVGPLMQSMDVGSTPDDDGEILGKDRKDDFENGSDENKGWSDGLW